MSNATLTTSPEAFSCCLSELGIRAVHSPPVPVSAPCTVACPHHASRKPKQPDRLVVDWLQRGQPTVAAEGNRSLGYLAVKRCLDVIGALGLLIVLSPIILAVLLILLVTTRGRPIFCQRRVGYLGRPFLMLKFRTMVPDAALRQHEIANEQNGPVFKNRCDPRITRIGRFLRKTSLDEIPQLLNVLAGQMSLVGPRPPVLREVVQYEPWQRRRLAVKPGLTCLWQVSGRCEIGFEDWVRMDLWYVKHQNLRTDLELLWRTPMSVLACRGAY
ncbi:MAG: sugar transferase [Pirellulales bacterium]|nr:sugar transferase [Pirellulales bacterium]